MKVAFRQVVVLLRKKTFIFIVLLLLFGTLTSVRVEGLSASAAIVMKADTYDVLFEKNSHERMSMASTTKIMTALLAVESGKLEQKVTVTQKMVAVEGTSMGLRKGDVLTLGNIVKGMMLLSGNDAANAVAYFLSGSAESFAEEMNKKAKLIGMNDTNFVTPSGLDDDEHYSTAYDMALLGSYAMKNPTFRQFVSSDYGKVSYILPKGEYTYRNHNRFLTMYDGACGIKTGFTKKSGRCLVTAVEKDGAYIVAVTLKAPDDWNDHISLYDECLPKIEKIDVPESIDAVVRVVGSNKVGVSAKVTGVPKISATESEQFGYRILTDKFLYAPISTGDRVGEVRFYLNGILVASRELVATESADRVIKENQSLKDKILNIFRRLKWQITA